MKTSKDIDGLICEQLSDVKPHVSKEFVWVIRKIACGPTLTCCPYEPTTVSMDELIPGEAEYQDFVEAWTACQDLDSIEKVLNT